MKKPFPYVAEIFEKFEKCLGFQNRIKWSTSTVIILYHVIGVYWCYYYTLPVKVSTVIFAAITFLFTGLGLTGGAHRLWTHKAYKAKLPMKLFLLMGFATSGQNSLYQWVRDHRVHHKFSDTEADPHNANRGLFFSHIGWLMLKKNDQVLNAGKLIDMSDITDDPLLRYFNKNFICIKILCCYIIPFVINVHLLGENWQCVVAWQFFLRFLTMFHNELTVNSLAHIYGYRPYNKNIVPKDNRFVATFTLGEGWHNYHHVFPYDYKAAEHFDFFNWCTACIRFFYRIGWAYDLREATPEMINSVADRLGDGTPVHCPIKKSVIDNNQ
ncbi:acyl-CoA Delta-9 desaturase-like [Bicyclus anynana]|uniref:Acyl-CoA Delta-9 desaturase-like n=1 Tax=Bicyclus anynana TaxID=110368 RepID=A0ABM3LTW8_BICAN|nr:acyl-CoA Delta-9 desaturase-like [Bicyclus anynana]XP_052742518.1 acyl-CoA Delta-9 desaturase-like [Bicyclus anynana]